MDSMKVLMASIACGMLTGSAFGQVRFAQNGNGQTTALTGLFHDADCSTSVDVSGRVIKREFAKDGLTVSGFVVERGDGTRKFVNVDVPNGLDMVTRDAVFDGLQRMLKQDRIVYGQAAACGAGGRFLTLERLK